MNFLNCNEIPLRVKSDYRGMINLSSNEMSMSPELGCLHNKFLDYVKNNSEMLCKYTFIEEVRSNYAMLLNIEASNLVFSPGSDTAIFYTLLALRNVTQDIILQLPNYFNYHNYATLLKYDIQEAGLSFDSVMEVVSNRTGCTVTITNPNGFTGEAWTNSQIVQLIERCKDNKHILIIDLAYNDYSNDRLAYSDITLENVILIKTWSKACAAAGIRVGEIIAHESFCENIKKLGIENSIGQLQLLYISFYIMRHSEFERLVEDVVTNRIEFAIELKRIFPDVYVYASHANFLAIRCSSKSQFMSVKAALEANQIVVKDLSTVYGFDNTLRITIGSITSIRKILEEVNVETR